MDARPSPSLKMAITPNYRVFHQFISKERWPELVDGKDVKTLMSLVHLDSNDPILPNLRRHIHAHLANYQARLDSHYMRRLISTRPRYTFSLVKMPVVYSAFISAPSTVWFTSFFTTDSINTYFRHDSTYATHHADVGYDAMDRYLYLVAPCVSLLVRNHLAPSEEYSFPIPPNIRTSCDDLVAAFQKAGNTEASYSETVPKIPDTVIDDEEEFIIVSEGSVDTPDLEEASVTMFSLRNAHTPGETRSPPTYCPIIQPLLRRVLVALFTQVPGDGCDGSFFSVIMHYLMLSSIRANAQWIPSGKITQTIAAHTFCGRLTLYAHMLDSTPVGQSINYHQ
jgi:hypothetical protein